jgi:1-aminocyclopropane-1-carboxylate deaminase/D-cysteine desulfhydrase-like pyridoxal-dependent ACC family enzyme
LSVSAADILAYTSLFRYAYTMARDWVPIVWRDLRFIVKRDDLLLLRTSLSTQTLSGNKVRKFHFLNDSTFLPERSLVASYGGLQSNSMNAIAALVANSVSSEFFYFVKSFPKSLRSSPVGNMERALANGMRVIQIDSELYKQLEHVPKDLRCFPVDKLWKYLPVDHAERELLWIPQGGALPEAGIGVRELCQEILAFIRSSRDSHRSWKIFISSGTGTTALHLARALASHISPSQCEVVAIPCVGTKEDLLDQMRALSLMLHGPEIYPTILPCPSTCPPTPFARPTPAHLEIWRSLNRLTMPPATASSEPLMLFDLVYAPKSFELMERSYLHYCHRRISDPGSDEYASLWDGYAQGSCQLIYYHCGGTEGNLSQLRRYQRLCLSDEES